MYIYVLIQMVNQLIDRFTDSAIPWLFDRFPDWPVDSLIRYSNDQLIRWWIDPLIYGFIDLLIRLWFGSLIYWLTDRSIDGLLYLVSSIDSLGRWCVDPWISLVHWFVGTLMR